MSRAGVSQRRWSGVWGAVVVSIALAAGLYAHTLRGTLIYDDRFHIEDDQRIHDVKRWGEYLTQGYYPGGVDHLWRPLTSLSFAVTSRLSGGRPWVFHLENVVFHAIASGLVALLAGRLLSARAAWVAGILFAAHPAHVEAVAYLVGRAETLCAIGVLGALVLMLGCLTTRRCIGLIACFLLAVFSKEQGLLLPVMLWMIWRMRRSGSDADERKRARAIACVILMFLPAYVSYRDHILPWYWEVNRLDYATQPIVRSRAIDRVLIPFSLTGRYAALLAAPVKLGPEYGVAVIGARQSWGDPYLYIGFAVACAIVAVTIWAWRRGNARVLTLLGCLAVSFALASNVRLIGVVFAERLAYLPSAFAFILVGGGVARWMSSRQAWAAVLLVAGVLGARTWVYAEKWNDRRGFYEWAVATRPEAVMSRLLLTRELMDAEDWQAARDTLEPAKRIAPEYWRVWTMSARLAIEAGDLPRARREIDLAWSLDPQVDEVLEVNDQLTKRRAATQPVK